jgi:hypothetical protein
MEWLNNTWAQICKEHDEQERYEQIGRETAFYQGYFNEISQEFEIWDESRIPTLIPIPQIAPKPLICQTIHLDLPQKGVNLGIELPLSTRLDQKLLQQTSNLKILLKTHGEQKKSLKSLLTPCELLQGFAHIYDPFERG